MGSPKVLFPLIEVADTPTALCVVLELVRVFCKGHTGNLDFMHQSGYRQIVFLLSRKKHLFTPEVLKACVALAIDNKVKKAYYDKSCSDQLNDTQGVKESEQSSKLLVDSVALKHLALNWELWGHQSREIFVVLLKQVNQLLETDNPNAVFNSHRLHNLGLVRWTLSIIMQAAKLAAANTPGWSFPRVTLEDAHWGRTTGVPDELLSLCAKLLQNLLLTRLAEYDVIDMASVLLATVGSPGTTDVAARSLLFNVEGTTPRKKDSFSGISGSRECLTAMSSVRICLLEILINLLTKEHDMRRKTSSVSAQGVVKKVMDFFAAQEAVLGGKAGGSFLVKGGDGGSNAGPPLIQDDRQEILKALAKMLSPDWFLCMLDGSGDSLSVSLLLRALFILFQEKEEYVQAFIDSRQGRGFAAFNQIVPNHSASPIVLLPLFAITVGHPLGPIPMFPDLKQTKVYDIIGQPEGSYRLPKGLFGPLIGALMDCLGKNLSLAKAIKTGEEEDEVASRARYCVDEVVSTLKNALEVSQPFREACRHKDFIAPMVQALFACADRTEVEMAMEQTRR